MGADTDPGWRAFFPGSVRAFPADLTAVVALVALTVGAALIPGVRETPLRVVLGIPLSLFAPGYALVAALFPERREAEGSVAPDSGLLARTDGTGIDGLERVTLSFGASIAVTPLLGLALDFTPWGVRLVPILIAVGGFTVVTAFVGARRRAALDPEDRFRVPYDRWLATARAGLFDHDTRGDALLGVALVVSLLLAAGAVGFTPAVPTEAETFSEFYLLTEAENGTLVADDYPTEFVAGEPESLVVAIDNHEGETVTYTVVSQVQRVRAGNGSTTVVETERLNRFSPPIAPNETWTTRQQVAPTMIGDRLRLAYLLYRGEAPADPTTANAYRSLHLWVNVTAPGAADDSAALRSVGDGTRTAGLTV